MTAAGTFEHGARCCSCATDPADADRLGRRLRQAAGGPRRRARPGRDDKVVAAWNGLAIAALAEAGLLLDRPDFIDRRAARPSC